MAPRTHDCFQLDDTTMAPDANGTADDAALTLRRPARRTGWTYLSHVASHPSNMVFLIGGILLSLMLGKGPVLLVLCVESLVLGVVPLFRRRTDEILDEADRAAAAKARAALILTIGETHRQELARIEALLARTFNDEGRYGVGPFPPGARLGLAALCASYVRLALAHKACEESLATTNPHAIEDTIRALESAEDAGPERTRELIGRRVTIARRRAACWTRTRENREALDHQIATIAELAQLVHMEALASPEPAGVGRAIDQLLSDFEESASALRELADVRVEVPFDLGELGAEGAVLAGRA